MDTSQRLIAQLYTMFTKTHITSIVLTHRVIYLQSIIHVHAIMIPHVKKCSTIIYETY